MLSSYWESVAIFAGINCLMGISLYIPMMAGLISLGQGGFMAIGAYVCTLSTKASSAANNSWQIGRSGIRGESKFMLTYPKLTARFCLMA